MHSLAREPQFRPGSAADFAHELGATTDVPTERLMATAITEALRPRTYQSVPGSGTWIWIAGAAAVALVAVVLGVLRIDGGGSSDSEPPTPVRIAPPARGATPAIEARNLSAWLRLHSD